MDTPEAPQADLSGRIAVWGVASTILTSGLSYILQIAVGRAMPPATFTEAQALLGLFMMLAMPIGPVLLVVTRRVVDERTSGHAAAILALLNGLLRRTVVYGLVALGLLWLARRPLSDLLGVTSPEALPVFALCVVINLLYLISVAVVVGRLQWRVAAILPVTLGLARLLLSVGLVRAGYGVTGIFIAITLSTSLSFVVAYAFAARALPSGGTFRSLHASDIALALTMNAAFWFLVHVDTIYVNSQLGTLAGRGYGAVAALARPVVYFPSAVNNLLFPFLAASRDPAERRRVIGRMLAATLALDAAVLVVVTAAPAFVLRVTFGDAYANVADNLAIVAATLTSLAVLNVVLYEGLTRHDRTLAAVFVAAAIVAAVLLVVTTPGLNGMLLVLAGCALGALGIGATRIARA